MRDRTHTLSIALAALAGLTLLAPHSVRAEATMQEPSTEVRFPVVREAGGLRFRCLGTGLRRVFFFKVYANTFCLDESKADAILEAARKAYGQGKTGEDLADTLEESDAYFAKLASSDSDKLVVMHMVRNVGRKKLVNAFREALEDILPKASIERLMGAIRTDAKDGQEVLFFTRGTKVTIQIGPETVEIEDPAVAKKIWTVWLGPDSVTPALREDIARRQAGAAE
ncbi:MAG: hypothetical protein D6729_15925 [Deltaproteobacteria bacterium]|nr:MAG: hypothetical protein D6729_15925 [Deltaproteobacteria bacterium]